MQSLKSLLVVGIVLGLLSCEVIGKKSFGVVELDDQNFDVRFQHTNAAHKHSTQTNTSTQTPNTAHNTKTNTQTHQTRKHEHKNTQTYQHSNTRTQTHKHKYTNTTQRIESTLSIFTSCYINNQQIINFCCRK